MTVELVPSVPADPGEELGDNSELLADLIMSFRAAAAARGAPTDEVRKGQLALLGAFGLLGDADGPPLSVVPDAGPVDGTALERGPMTDAELIKEFAQWMRRRGLRPSTIRMRRNMLNLAVRQLPNGLSNARKSELEAWLDRGTLSDRSRAHYLSHLKAFYAWAVEDELLPRNPAKSLRTPKYPRRLVPRPMPTEELQLALEHATPQMRCWLLLGAYGGFRCCEMAGLEREDVREVEGMLRITQGKGGHQRTMPLHPDVLQALEALPMPAHGPLFSRPLCGGRATPASVSESINAYLHALGIKSTAHTLRHWFASAVYGDTLDIRLTQELMGHASPDTTAIYAACDVSKSVPTVCALSVERSGGGLSLEPA